MKKISLFMLFVVWSGIFYASHNSSSNNQAGVNLPLISSKFLIDDKDPYRLFQTREQRQAARDSFDKNASSKAVLKKAALNVEASYSSRTTYVHKLAPLNVSQNSGSPFCASTDACTPISDIYQGQSNSPVPFSARNQKYLLPSLNQPFIPLADIDRAAEELESRRQDYDSRQNCEKMSKKTQKRVYEKFESALIYDTAINTRGMSVSEVEKYLQLKLAADNPSSFDK